MEASIEQRGWALGREAFRQDLLANHSVALEARAWPEGGAAEVRKRRWQMALNEALSRVPCDTRDAAHKSAPWKVAIAAHLKATTVYLTDGSSSNSAWDALAT